MSLTQTRIRNVVGRTWSLGSYFSLKDDVSVSCCSSIVCGSSTWSTEPRKPSSIVAPGVGSGLYFASEIVNG